MTSPGHSPVLMGYPTSPVYPPAPTRSSTCPMYLTSPGPIYHTEPGPDRPVRTSNEDVMHRLRAELPNRRGLDGVADEIWGADGDIRVAEIWVVPCVKEGREETPTQARRIKQRVSRIGGWSLVCAPPSRAPFSRAPFSRAPFSRLYTLLTLCPGPL